MDLPAAIEAWRGRDGPTLLLVDRPRLAAAERLLDEAGVAVRRLGAELLARMPDELIDAELRLAPRPDSAEPQLAWAGHKQAVRRALEAAFSDWLSETAGERCALVDLELALGERLPLERLIDQGAPMLLLVPGRREGAAVIHAPDETPVRLPPALCARCLAVGEAGG